MHATCGADQRAGDDCRATSPVPDAATQSDSQRYRVDPVQATAYKGCIFRIQALRRKAEAELGDGFDIRGFHDAVLGGGALPLDLLERRVDRWIAEQKNTAA